MLILSIAIGFVDCKSYFYDRHFTAVILRRRNDILISLSYQCYRLGCSGSKRKSGQPKIGAGKMGSEKKMIKKAQPCNLERITAVTIGINRTK